MTAPNETPPGTPDPYTHANPMFVQAVRNSPQAALAILDVGCWNGTLGKVLMARSGVTVDGVELDAAQGQHARDAGYRTVHCLDLNRDAIAGIGERYDFILFGDVLEHLQDPARTLGGSIGLLAPGGKVMVSLPNIAFFICRLKHLLGRWDYAEYGIMDRTHLRFFTLRTMREMLAQCGFEVGSVQGYVGLSGYPWFVRTPLRWLGRVWPTLFAIQIVLSARPASGK